MAYRASKVEPVMVGSSCLRSSAPEGCPSTWRSGLTLLETLLATTLLIFLMELVFWFYGNTLETRRDGLQRSANLQLARVILDRMAGEIRLASAHTEGYGTGLKGDRVPDLNTDLLQDRIRIRTLTVPDRLLSKRRSLTDAEIAGQFDLREIEYFIAWDEEDPDEDGKPQAWGLIRRVRTTLNQSVFLDDAPEVMQEWYPEIKYLELRYFDGVKWWEEWTRTEPESLPLLVRITVGFEPVVLEDEELDPLLLEDEFTRPEEEREELAPDRHTIFVAPVQSNRIGALPPLP